MAIIFGGFENIIIWQRFKGAVTVKPVTRGHLNVKIAMSKLHFL